MLVSYQDRVYTINSVEDLIYVNNMLITEYFSNQVDPEVIIDNYFDVMGDLTDEKQARIDDIVERVYDSPRLRCAFEEKILEDTEYDSIDEMTEAISNMQSSFEDIKYIIQDYC